MKGAQRRRARRTVVPLIALMSVASCTPPPAAAPLAESPALPDISPPPEPQPAPSPIDLDRLDALLTLGDEALKADRLLTPIDDCAYDYYSAALELAPDHPAAPAGLDKIVDRYVNLATDAAQRGRFDRARNLLERAKFVNSAHEGIALVESRIAQFEDASSRSVPLDAGALAARSSSLADELARLGIQAKAEHAWVTINARNDAEGRWIYQQLRRAPGNRRIRAELVLAAAPSVVIFELQPEENPP
jgi:hypothetical protein